MGVSYPRRHYPGVGHHAHPAPSQAGLRPASYCTCSFSPRNVRLGCLSPRRRAWSRGRRVRSGGVSHPFERLKSPLKSSPRSLPKPPLPRSSPRTTREASPSAILRGLSRPHWAALRLAVGHSGGLPQRAGGAAIGGSRRGGRWGERGRRGGAKRAFVLPIP
jgi:hypothetical protein